MSILDKLLWKIVESIPSRSRVIETEGSPYLLRFYIKHNGLFPGIYLHYFFRGDSDRDLHNHPWKTSFSLILTGGYKEERLVNNVVIQQLLLPGSINIIRANDFHRVDLLKNGCWTIFVSGRETQNWGFYVRDTKQYIPSNEYIGNK